ncbi:MAG TPA: amidase [Acidimicrobiales bacterium]|nr:amidase [Acidimicrobiales bacterium]
MADDLATLDATAQADLVRRGELTPHELVEAGIERIERVDPEIGSVAIRLFDRARHDTSAQSPPGAFPGVPTVVKDTVPTAGDPWHRGMALLRAVDHHATTESHVVTRMRESGLVIVGKANVGELEGGITTEPVAYGPTRNPWDLRLSVGGSSGGPAAAVAAGLVPLALGVDGGGSIRIPASVCGVVGLKPSRGRTSLHPLFIEDGASTAGLLTRTVRDSARGLDAIAGSPHGDHFIAPPPARPYADEVGADPGRLRIGVWSPVPGGVTAHDDCRTAADETARVLESLGHNIEVSHPAELDSGFFHTPDFVVSAACHIAYQIRQIEAELGRTVTADEVEPVTWAAVSAASGVAATSLQRSLALNREAGVRYASWWDSGGFDILLTPTIAVLPYPLGALTQSSPDQPWPDIVSWVPFTPHANLAGLPAISLPLHWNAEGHPIGTQLVARYGREDLLLRVASQLEAARPWAHRRPPTHA